jgi:pimeloyl-ACP methyl ester carboxylesterase
MEVGFHTVDGVRVRCAESTSLSAPTILLTSPWPESVYAFARVWASLAAVARLVAVDLPGFGQAGRPEP